MGQAGSIEETNNWFKAAEDGNVEMMKAYFSRFPAVLNRGISGATCKAVKFETAVRQNCLRYLSDSTDFGTALHIAIGNGHLPVVQFLIENHASVYLMDWAHRDALNCAIFHDAYDIFVYLVREGNIPFNRLACSPFQQVLRHQRFQLACVLLRWKWRELDLNRRDNLGSYPLHDIVEWKDEEENAVALASWMIFEGADLETRNREGLTPFQLALSKNQVRLAQTFLDLGATLRHHDLHIAVRRSVDLVKLLLKYGAQPSACADVQTLLDDAHMNVRGFIQGYVDAWRANRVGYALCQAGLPEFLEELLAEYLWRRTPDLREKLFDYRQMWWCMKDLKNMRVGEEGAHKTLEDNTTPPPQQTAQDLESNKKQRKKDRQQLHAVEPDIVVRPHQGMRLGNLVTGMEDLNAEESEVKHGERKTNRQKLREMRERKQRQRQLLWDAIDGKEVHRPDGAEKKIRDEPYQKPNPLVTMADRLPRVDAAVVVLAIDLAVHIFR